MIVSIFSIPTQQHSAVTKRKKKPILPANGMVGVVEAGKNTTSATAHRVPLEVENFQDLEGTKFSNISKLTRLML
jgi:hypothetical protein